MELFAWLAFAALASLVALAVRWPVARGRRGIPPEGEPRGPSAAYEAWARSAGPSWYGEIVGKPPDPPEAEEPEERV